VLRVLVHAITAGVIAWPLTVEEGVIAAMVGAGAGSFGARFLAKSTLRLPAIVALGFVAMLVVMISRFLVVDLGAVPAALGPANALLLGDAVVFGLGGLVVSLVLRALSARKSSFMILEAALIAGGFATLLVAHRHGAIHRPYELADPLIASGEDPTLAILLVGALGAAVIGLLFLSERSVWRSIFHVSVVLGLLLFILGTTTMAGLPAPPSTGGALGLQDDDSEERQRAAGHGGGGSGQSGRRSSDDLEFQDQYPSGGGAPDAVVIFHDDYSPPGGYYYFRQNAFSQYNGRKLVAATRADVDTDVRNVFPTGRSRAVPWVPPAGADRTTVETTVALLADNSGPLGLEAPERFVPATNPNPQRFRRLYRVQSVSLTSDFMILLDREAGDAAWGADVREHYLRSPDDPRYGVLAQHIVSQLPPDLQELPMARVVAITQYLGEHGTYSLRSRHAAAADPTADFVFGDLTGYCVHFAHAAVYLMRAVGIPARVGTGYAVAEANRAGGSGLLLRNSDQHAWPEVYLQGAGWVVADVSPATVLDPPGEPPDPQLQRLLAEMARGAEPIEDAPQPPRPMAELVRSLRTPLLEGLGALFVALFAFFYANKVRRRVWRPSPRAIYRACLDRLAESGLRRRWGESPEAFAARLRTNLPSLGRLTDRHLGAAFGGHGGDDVVRTMIDDARRLRRELRGVVPWWRRTLGLLNPFSWLLTR
jgi:transglutaminase-like putative cysteine protease